MELRHLRYFCAVAEECHFGRAAKRLRIAQPPLSVQIRQLQEELGAPLFERDGRGVALTAAGKAFWIHSQKILGDVEHAATEARAISRGDQGRLAIGFVGSVLNEILTPALLKYRRLHPDVKLTLREMTTARQIAGLGEHVIDVGIIATPSDPEEFGLAIRNPDSIAFKTAHREPLVVAMAAKHQLARRGPIRLAALVSEKFSVVSRDASPGLHDQFVRLCEAAGFQPEVIFEHAQCDGGLGFVATGLAIELVPKCYERLKFPGVVFRPLIPHAIRLETRIAWNRSLVSPTTRRFLDLLNVKIVA